MNIKRAKEEIKNTVHAYLLKDEHGEYVIPAERQRPVLLMGPPGIGKTQIMEQAARECGIGLVSYTITHHTRQSAIGLPFIREKEYGGVKKHVTEYTMSEIVAAVYDCMEATGLSEGILFLDEINCVSETLAPAMLQFPQYKTFGNHKIPDGWIVVTAGNPPEYNKSVREFDLATLDRVKRIDVEADFSVWKEYAKNVRIHPAIVSYLTTRPQYFCTTETTVDGKRFVTPRGWEDLSRFLEVCERLGTPVDREVALQYAAHPKIAGDFANYLELYYKYLAKYQIEEVLRGHRDETLIRKASRADFDERLSVISLLLSGLETAFWGVGEKKAGTELLFGVLKEFKALVLAEGGTAGIESSGRQNAGAASVFEALVHEFQEDHERKKKAKLLSREQEYRYRDAEAALNGYLLTLKSEELSEPETAFSRVRELFGNDREAYFKACEDTAAMLEHAFDFMEAAFGDSQEMVSFISELNSSPHAVAFLKEQECERYYQYNKKLLFEDREAELLRRLDSLEGL